MRNKVLVSIGGIVIVLAFTWAVSTQLHGQAISEKGEKYAVPRTAWGDPDLQGQWNSQTSTPLERPQTGALAGRDTITAEEAESLEVKHLADGDAPPAAGDPGTYNSFWFDRGKGLNRTSLIIDPPDGRVPAFTPEAEQRIAAERVARLSLQRFIEQEQIGEDRAQVARRVQVVDELRSNRGLCEHKPHGGPGVSCIVIEHAQERLVG